MGGRALKSKKLLSTDPCPQTNLLARESRLMEWSFQLQWNSDITLPGYNAFSPLTLLSLVPSEKNPDITLCPVQHGSEPALFYSFFTSPYLLLILEVERTSIALNVDDVR